MRDLARVKSEEHWQDYLADQRIRDMVGIIDTDGMSRDDGWRYDLAFLAREIKRLAYAPFAIQPEAEFDRSVAELDAAIPGLTDAQILVGLMKLVRHLDDGHASIRWPDDDKERSRMLPVDLFWFTEGLHVIGVAPGLEHLLGARVDKVGGLTPEEVMAALDPVITRDNELLADDAVPGRRALSGDHGRPGHRSDAVGRARPTAPVTEVRLEAVADRPPLEQVPSRLGGSDRPGDRRRRHTRAQAAAPAQP